MDLVSEPVDIAIRMGDVGDLGLIARLLARLSVQAYASPGYLEITGEPAHSAELAGHEGLGFAKPGTWGAASRDGDGPGRGPGAIRREQRGMFCRLRRWT